MQKGSKDFDDIFKNKLSSLSADSNPGDWIMMERLLEMEGLTQEHQATDETRFDEVALDKLNGITTEEFIPDWDRMSSMIDDMNEEPSMEPSEFDQAIDNQIKNTVFPLEMAAWNRLEPILDRDRAAVVEDLDAVAKGKLTQISEIEPAWGYMNSKINRELFLPESIVKYKVIEVALILLFAFSASQFPIKEITEKVANLETSIQIETQKVKAAPILNTQETTLDTEAINSNSETVSTTVQLDQTTSLPAAETLISESATLTNSIVNGQPDEDLATVSISLSDEPIWDLPPSIVDALDQHSTSPSFRFTPEAYVYIFNPINISGFDKALAFLDLYDQQLVENVFGKQSAQFNLSNIGAGPATPMDIALLDQTEIPSLSNTLTPSPLINLAPLSLATNSGLILSMFTGSDYNEIVTPFDPVYAKEGTQQWNVGYAGGLALGMRFKNWELETGAIYASNQYQPRKLYEISSGSISTGYIASTLRDIELEVVKIPLNFRFNVNLWDKWKVYALSGATMNMVVQSEFVTDDVLIVKGSFASPASPVAQSPGLTRKDFGEGILEGGSFRDNSYFTANLGFGVERTLNNKWSVFAQPTYQRQIFSNGIGPNQDRYNAISLFLGTRVALSKKSKK